MKKVQSAAIKVLFNDNEGKRKDHICIFSVFSILHILKMVSLYHVLTHSNEIILPQLLNKLKKFSFKFPDSAQFEFYF